MGTKILVVDDDLGMCSLLRTVFEPRGFTVAEAHDGLSALEAVRDEEPELVILDLRLPGMDGMEVLETLRAERPSLAVVMLTGSQDVRDAVRATQLGAFDYLTKPFDRDDLLLAVDRALENRALRLEVQALRHTASKSGCDRLIAQMGTSLPIRHLVAQVSMVARSDFSVLIRGETGTGKELVAQAVHDLSERRRGPLVALDCGAIPEPLMESELFGHEKGAFTGAERRRQGRFGLAEGGTCFLDEIGNLPMPLQAKLLRVLESRQVQPVGAERTTPLDVRFVAATNQDLREREQQGLFRADLYFRLAQYTIALPPLRERREDIPLLAGRFLEEARIEVRRPIQVIVPEALGRLAEYDWPGNVRELRNVVRQAVLQTTGLAIRAETIGAVLGHAPEAAAPPPAVETTGGRPLRDIASRAAAAAERQAISEALRAYGGNKSKAARALQTDYKTLHVKMKQLGIRARDFAGA
jgi:DNA-binding NtrC family response regulator